MHDFAYADIGFDGYEPPSILQAEGAKECAVELYSMTKSFSMAGWRVAFLVGNAEVVAALVKLKSYLDYGTFQPIQIAATVTMNEAPDYPEGGLRDLPEPPRRAVRRPRPHRLGRRPSPRARCSSGRPSPSPTRRWARSSSRRSWCGRRGGHVARASGSAPAATATCASRSSRTSSASRQAIRNLRRGLTKLASRAPRRRDAVDRCTEPLAPSGRRDACGTARAAVPDGPSSGSGCPTGPARSGRWPAASARCGATWSASRSSSGARAGPSTSSWCDLPEAGLVDLLVAEIDQVDGVDVEDVRAVVGQPHAAGSSGAGHGRAHGRGGQRPTRCSLGLCQDICRALGGDWATVVRLDPPAEVASAATRPRAAWLGAFVARRPAASSRADADGGAPPDLAWAAARPGRPRAGRRPPRARPSAARSASSWPCSPGSPTAWLMSRSGVGPAT